MSKEFFERALEDLQKDPDISARAKARIEKNAYDAATLAINEGHLTYLMGRTDAAREALAREIQRQKETPTAA